MGLFTLLSKVNSSL